MVWFNMVLNDHTHPLYSEFIFMPSGRRLTANKCRTERLIRSAVPAAIRLYKLNIHVLNFLAQISCITICNT